MARLSDEDFHAQATEEGASRHYRSNEVPDRGYMVGGARNLDDLPFPEMRRPVDQFELDDVRHHARAIRDQFAPTASVYQGAWREGDEVVLDASERDDNFASAITKAKIRGEKAIYDVRRGRDIHVKDVEGKVKN